MMRKLIIPTLISFLLCSCSVFQKSAKQELTDGYYSKKAHQTRQKVYVDIVDESIQIYPTVGEKSLLIDTAAGFSSFEHSGENGVKNDFTLAQSSFDLDFLTIPIKYRFSKMGVPSQLNAELNGSVYFGLRRDVYRIDYVSSPLKSSTRGTLHFGYSIGIFSGIGNTFLSPTTTFDQIQQEYDGVIWSRGVAGIFAVNSFTVGLSVGFDYLLDKNKGFWIYQNKPWIGIALGLNLN